MRATTILQPDRRFEARASGSIKRQIPPRLRLSDQQQFDCLTASAGTAHADAPVFAAFAPQNQVATGANAAASC